MRSQLGLSLYFAKIFAKFGLFPDKKIREIRGFLAEGHANWRLVRNFLRNLV
jgi:hypothetical protein